MPLNYTHTRVNASNIESYFTYAFGNNPLGWGNSIAVTVAIIFLVSFSPFNAAAAIFCAGGGLFGVELVFIFNNPLLSIIIPIVLIIGAAYALMNRGGNRL